jgi:hypothetical protein
LAKAFGAFKSSPSGVPTCLSARLYASLNSKVIKGLTFLGIPAGYLKRKAPITFELEAARPVQVFREEKLRPGDLSETAGAKAKAEA